MFLDRRAKRLLAVLLVLLTPMLGMSLVNGQALPVFRVGIVDSEGGSLTRGAQLAASMINAGGGVIGADGTAFQLQLVVQSEEDVDFALSNINQARVIAVIGPVASGSVLANSQQFTDLGVPILTAATDDSLLITDTTDRLFRIRAQELLHGRALARYLIGDLSAATIVTVQMDVESTVSVVGFVRSLQELGAAPIDQYVLSNNVSLQQIVLSIGNSMPQFVVAYGEPSAAAELYTELRSIDWPGRFIYNRAGSVDFRSAVDESLLEGIFGVSTWCYTYEDEASLAFTRDYIVAFGELPDALAASAYDSIFLLKTAIALPGSLQNNLLAIRNQEGIQGRLSPADLPPGEMSDNTCITELGEFGAPRAVARFAGTERVPLIVTTEPVATPSPAPTATPDGVYVVITRSVQNIRTGPGLNYDILGQLQQGEQARVIGATIDFGWVAIEFRGTVGWLSRGILDLIGDTTTVPVLAAPPTPTPLPATATPTAQPFPDIVVVNAQPNRIVIGAPFIVTATIYNQGGVNAGPFAMAATFEPGGAYSAVNLPGMAANSQMTVTFSGVLAGGTGPQNVTIVADLNNQVAEGPGENNNFAFVFPYIADAPLLTTAPSTGAITLSDLGTTTLDGGSQDIQWGGGGLVPLGATRLAVLTGFATIDQVHRDAIANAPLANVPVTPITPGQIIGIETDGGLKHGVLQIVSAQPGGQITFNFRMYDN